VLLLLLCVFSCRAKIKNANPGFLDTTLSLLVTHGMAEHKPAVEYVFTQLGRPLPPPHAAQVGAVLVCLGGCMFEL
jgi:hypothetical protein